LAKLPLHLVEQGQQEVGCARGGVRVAFAQLRIEKISRLADAGDQRMVDTGVVVSVVADPADALDLDRSESSPRSGAERWPFRPTRLRRAANSTASGARPVDCRLASIATSRDMSVRSEPRRHLGIVVARPLLGGRISSGPTHDVRHRSRNTASSRSRSAIV